MRLQIALDEIELEQALSLVDSVRTSVDIIEIGTPFIMKEGMRAVRAFRERFPEKEILADTKIMDAGRFEADLAFEAGADYVTVLAVTDDRTISGCLESAREHSGQVFVDMICVDDNPSRTRELESLGITHIAVHTGVDMQAAGRVPLDDLKEIREATPRGIISVAGGISIDTVDEYLAAGADVIIAGGTIAHSNDPTATAMALSRRIHQMEK